jgi:DNA-binding Lrp family transcriptional regulator
VFRISDNFKDKLSSWQLNADLDKLDVKILKELIRNNVMPFPGPSLRKSFREIGRNLRVDQGTVRNRVRKIQEMGILKGWYLGINPFLFGKRMASMWFSVQPQSEKSNVMRKISLIEGVILQCNYLGPKLSAVVCYDTEQGLRKTTELIARIANSEDMFRENKSFLACRNLPNSTDWSIIRSLQQDPWKPYSMVAKELGISTKTVKRRVTKLVEQGAIYLLVKVNLKSFEGIIPADLVVLYDDRMPRDKTNESIVELLGDMLVFADLHDPNHGYFALNVSNASMTEELKRLITKQKGVADARIEILQEVVSLDDFYKEQVGKLVNAPVEAIE